MTVSSFLTSDGVVVPAITATEMREVDRLAIEEIGPNLYQMMENAGRNLALAVIEKLGSDWISRPIVVLAGTGGNGGGGICAARHVANRGADVTVVVSDISGLTPVPREQLSVYQGTDGRLATPNRVASLEASIVVDPVIGYSLSGALHGAAYDLIDWANHQPSPVIAPDVPSGLDSTTGAAAGVHTEADLTLTLALPKTGLDVPAVGELWLADIGIPIQVYRRLGVEIPVGMFAAGYRVRLRPG